MRKKNIAAEKKLLLKLNLHTFSQVSVSVSDDDFFSTRHQLWKAFDVKMRCAHLNYRHRKRHHQPVCVSALGRLRKFNIFSLSSRPVSLWT